MATQKGLGKGLGALFGDINEQTETPAEGAVSLPLQKIEPNPLQPRKTFDPDELASLAESIRMHGIIQPLTVRKLPSGFYQIIAGERRWRAARLAGLSDVPVVIIEADDKKAMDSIAVGERVEIVATDAGFARDASAWCDTTGNKLIEKHDEKGRYTVVIEKGAPACTSASNVSAARGRGKTLILFSDDLDKALATFVLANGAAATGQKVTIFFTFWGLNVLKKVQKPSVQKDFFGKMFGMMLPSSSLKLKLSQMNMFGMGSRMMRFLMKRKGVDSLESLRSQALAQGVEFIACQMSMDMMGIQHEELLDEVTIGGVATYMERADKANVNLFI